MKSFALAELLKDSENRTDKKQCVEFGDDSYFIIANSSIETLRALRSENQKIVEVEVIAGRYEILKIVE